MSETDSTEKQTERKKNDRHETGLQQQLQFKC